MNNSFLPESIDETSVGLSDELKTYLFNKFSLNDDCLISTFKDPQIEFWEESLMNLSDEKDIFNMLKEFYPQLNFLIEKEIDKLELYNNVVLRGKTNDIKLSAYLKLEDAKNISIEIHESAAGRIPVLVVPNKEDFVKILQSLVHKNNPVPIPSSMGAVLLNGLNNWKRLNSIKKNWQQNNPFGDWNAEFSNNIMPNKSLYKDKLIILSTKPYSNVSAGQLGLEEDLWISYSISIRKEHEFTHLYTLKKFGQATNNLHDELIADYIGIIKTIWNYDKVWMLTFMGLENYPHYRQGARLENYVKEAKLSPDDFTQLITIIKNAIENIAIFDKSVGKLKSAKDQTCRIDALCEMSLTDLASANGAEQLIDIYYENFHRTLF
ncbi:hypothetical protein ASE21_00470 [Flavobacterium sp. Root901]|uniref:DUF7005 family protein n=1 Tax=Flavobacterium sp. Root901 TaxID=1736605 RepID=UPI0007100F31|nr:hypothetical protein [Flavobacterium sp. Root901]KRD12420.1 hypothetical protein ASE21_00470 [Flavobacterium sp. Root901]